MKVNQQIFSEHFETLLNAEKEKVDLIGHEGGHFRAKQITDEGSERNELPLLWLENEKARKEGSETAQQA